MKLKKASLNRWKIILVVLSFAITKYPQTRLPGIFQHYREESHAMTLHIIVIQISAALIPGWGPLFLMFIDQYRGHPVL